ncbi:hypothetical protein RND81_06G124800 [Saponaria officinalis]|uniref:Retrotransposon gag protein n=1 Tax=Saponaria officinalis TaxID=3572 RepID=A0AAW1K5S3_SAPOF
MREKTRKNPKKRDLFSNIFNPTNTIKITRTRTVRRVMAEEATPDEMQQLREQIAALTNTVAALALQNNVNQGNAHKTKLRFPLFDGDNVESWLFRCEQYFSVQNMDKVMKVTFGLAKLQETSLKMGGVWVG